MASKLRAPGSASPTTNAASVARGAQGRATLDQAVDLLIENGVVAQLMAMAPHATQWTGTTANREAYRHGIDRGVHGRALENPYPYRPNSMHLRGINDPNAAFHEGWVDGIRIRSMIKDPRRSRGGIHPGMRSAEVQVLKHADVPIGRSGALIEGADEHGRRGGGDV